MATPSKVEELRGLDKQFEKYDLTPLLRADLGKESLEGDFKERWEKLQELRRLFVSFAPGVHDTALEKVTAHLKVIFQQMVGLANLAKSADFITHRPTFLINFDQNVEAVKQWIPPFVAAAVLDRGFLEDEGIRQEYKRTVDNLREEAKETLKKVKEEADAAVKNAQDLAEEIETRSRRTAAKISMKDAQTQFQGAINDLRNGISVWGALSVASIAALLYLPFRFMDWPLAQETDAWPVHLYHTILRVIVLSAVAGLAAFSLKLLRAYIHLRQKNKHRLRVANSIEGFVNAAVTPEQRDVVLSRLVDEVIDYGNAGLVGGEDDLGSSTASSDLISRVVSALSSRGGK